MVRTLMTWVATRRAVALRSCRAGLTLAAVLSLAAALAAPASAASNRVLILGGTVTGGASSIEATEAAAQGMAVDVVDDATWSSMTAAQFASYRAIILGDPTCYGPGTSPSINAATANAKVWGPVINGNIVVIGSDPVFHQSQGGATLTQRGIDFALAQGGKTGAYIALSCYYHDAASETPVPLLDGIGPGGFKVTGVGCYNNAHIVAQSAAVGGLTDANLSNWSCSVHEAFTAWPGALVPLAIAKDFSNSYTASDGTQGPPYILAGGDIRSFPLSVSPLNDSGTPGGSHTVTAQLLDGATRAPVAGAKLVFSVVSGPNVGARGSCTPSTCLTDSNGHVAFSYTSNRKTGVDNIQVFYDNNGNRVADPGEPATTAGMTWQTPSNVRYVALGDSIPYGHGLADPTRNNGPSHSAYPDVVDRGLGLKPLSYRPTGCGLTAPGGGHYDQLAISGAPSIDSTWTGGNANCNLPYHEAVFTDEVASAGLKANPPGLVTIQAGADDINFAGCLESVLGAPSQLGAEKCITQDAHGYHLTSRVNAELGSLRTGLTATISYVHRNAPHAQVVVMKYYQIIPQANADLQGSSTICRDLRFSRQGGAWRQSIRSTADYLQQQLNATIASATQQFSDVYLVDLSNIMSGHEMCAQNTWLFDGLHNAAHPTATGQWQIGQTIINFCSRRPRKCIGR